MISTLLPVSNADRLTPREAELVALLMSGMTSTTSLAAAMSLSVHTVHDYVAEILRKFDVSDRAQAVSYARENGHVTAGRWQPRHP